MRKSIFGLIFLMCCVSLKCFAGDLLKVSCHGEGPSLSKARASALKDCHSSAISRLRTDFEVKSLAVQTENDAALHEELKTDQKVEGLTCLNPKETTEEHPSSFVVNMTCSYDPSKVRFLKTTERLNSQLNADQEDLKHEGNLIDQQEGIAVVLSIIPSCDSIVVESSSIPRIIRCKENPIRLVLKSSDVKVIIRQKNYRPANLNADDLRGKHGPTQIILEP